MYIGKREDIRNDRAHLGLNVLVLDSTIRDMEPLKLAVCYLDGELDTVQAGEFPVQVTQGCEDVIFPGRVAREVVDTLMNVEGRE